MNCLSLEVFEQKLYIPKVSTVYELHVLRKIGEVMDAFLICYAVVIDNEDCDGWRLELGTYSV